MRFLSIRLLQNGSSDVTFGVAVRRVLAVLLSIVPLGLGYLAILRDPHRRAWHDRLTGTEVVYEVVARTAPHAGPTAGPAAAAHRRGRPREDISGAVRMSERAEDRSQSR
jgi:uncharacterized RDD family membrane protein YckC